MRPSVSPMSTTRRADARSSAAHGRLHRSSRSLSTRVLGRSRQCGSASPSLSLTRAGRRSRMPSGSGKSVALQWSCAAGWMPPRAQTPARRRARSECRSRSSRSRNWSPNPSFSSFGSGRCRRSSGARLLGVIRGTRAICLCYTDATIT